MKRMLFVGCGVLVFSLMVSVWVSYGEMIKQPISSTDLSDLKGKWDGSRTTSRGGSANTDLEIHNDKPPLKGKFDFHNVMVRGGSGKTLTINFQNGKITSEGDLMIEQGQDKFELSLYKGDGKTKLEGNFWWKGFSGTMTFRKK